MVEGSAGVQYIISGALENFGEHYPQTCNKGEWACMQTALLCIWVRPQPPLPSPFSHNVALLALTSNVETKGRQKPPVTASGGGALKKPHLFCAGVVEQLCVAHPVPPGSAMF